MKNAVECLRSKFKNLVDLKLSDIIAINLVSDHLAGEHNHVKLLCQVGILTVLHNYHIFNSYNGEGGI